MATVSLKPISELFGLSFWIPSYQRGYRWTKIQIQELLEDLYDFASKKKDDDDYYCLQPVIVKKRGDSWELVDGQQRLTAMWLISAFYYCSNREDVVDLERKQYSLTYEEKDVFTNAFSTINSFVEIGSMKQAETSFSELKKECIDSRHLVESIEYIVKFTYENKTAKGVLAKIFEAIDDIKIIWYVLEESENAIQTFTNINANKIELTNAELIKAILLHSADSENSMQNMALLWEEMEKGLNNDSFWSFIVNSSKKKYVTRIDYLFEIWCVKNGFNITADSVDKHIVFRKINSHLNDAKSQEKASALWHQIQEIYETLTDWYNDYFYYHTIGLLLIISETKKDVDIINELYNSYSTTDKKEFKRSILDKIKNLYFGSTSKTPFNEFALDNIRNDLNDVTFGIDSKVKHVLLLYNIAMLINANNTYERFPFDLYKAETWDIEHINPQTPKEASEEEKREWLESYKKIFSGSKRNKNILSEISKCLKSNFENFDVVAQTIVESLEIADNNSITNLVLLDASTNRGYKNSCFSDKRKKIIDVERNKTNDEKYIPIGTKWVFLKGFENAEQLKVWSGTDMKDYADDIAGNIYKMMAGETNV